MKEYYYPLWLRIWHWINAILFLVLIFTGISLHYSIFVNFKSAVSIHNIAGISLTLNYIFFFIGNIISGNWRQYIPKFNSLFKDLFIQVRYYVYGIFVGEPHPFETSPKQKFNPLQGITYLFIMYLFMIIIILSGIALLIPELIVKQVLGTSGLTLTTIVHAATGFFLSVFMIGHIYLATTGTTILSNFKAMITGWHSETKE